MAKRPRGFANKREFDQAVTAAKRLTDDDSKISGSSTVEVLKTGLDTIESEGPELNYQLYLFRFILGAKTRNPFWDVLRLTAQEKLRNSESLPPLLALWVANVLDDDGWGRPGGRDPEQSFAENLRIAFAVRFVVDTFGVKATRRPKLGGPHCGYSKGASACDAVGVAANMHGYRNVARIWNDYQQYWPDLSYTNVTDMASVLARTSH